MLFLWPSNLVGRHLTVLVAKRVMALYGRGSRTSQENMHCAAKAAKSRPTGMLRLEDSSTKLNANRVCGVLGGGGGKVATFALWRPYLLLQRQHGSC